MHEARLALRQPEVVFDGRTAERHLQHARQRLIQGVGDEILHLHSLLVHRRHQLQPPSTDQHLDLGRTPPGVGHRLAALPPPHPAGRAVGRQHRVRPPGLAASLGADAEGNGHLPDEPLVHQAQPAQERHLAAVALVERQPVERHPVAVQPDQLVQRDPPLRPLAHVGRDARGLAPFAVLVPRLGQVQVAVQQRLDAAPGDADVDGDDAVIDLADAAEVLALHAGRLVPFFRQFVSSITPTVPSRSGGRPGSTEATWRWSVPRAAPCSQRATARNAWRVRTAVPASSAIGSTLLRGRSDSSARQ